MPSIRELMEQRAALVTQEREHLERLEKEGRALLGDDQTQYEKRAKDIGDLDVQISGMESRDKALESAKKREGQLAEQRTRRAGGGEQAKGNEGQPDEMRTFSKFLRRGLQHMSEAEVRAFTVGSDVEGGYLRVPNVMVGGILAAVDDATVLRSLATVYQVGGAESLGVVTRDADAEDATWTAELLTGDEEDSVRFGKRELRVHPIAKRLKVSNKLLNSTVIDIAGYLQGRMGYKLGITLEKAMMTGDGNQKPLGIFTAHADGIPTSRDVSTGNTTTAIVADGLIEAKHSIKAQYWSSPSFRWTFHRDALKQVRKLKLGDGQYIWQAGITSDLPARILDTPYVASEYCPNTFTTGQYVGIIGDFRYLWIAEGQNQAIQVLRELYAETNQTGYILRAEIDAQPVMAEAFARVKLA